MKNPAAVKLGRLGGLAGTGAAKARTTKQARAAARARWEKKKTKGNAMKAFTAADRDMERLKKISKASGYSPAQLRKIRSDGAADDATDRMSYREASASERDAHNNK